MSISEQGKTAQVVVARIKEGQCLFKAITALLKKHKIKYGYIPVVHGCFSDCTILTVLANPHSPQKLDDIEITFDEPVVYSGNGTIAEDSDGKPFIHLHPTIAKSDGRSYAGHLIKGTLMLTTEIVIVETTGFVMNRKPAPDTNNVTLLNVDKE